MMKRIILHGHLKKLYDKPIEVEAETVAEAMSSLKFIPELQPKDGQPWPVTIQGVTTQPQLFAPSDMEEIHVYPRTGGAGGRGGLLQILLGVTLIAVALFFPGAYAAGTLLGGLGVTKGMLILTGAMMVLGGIMQMLMPVPETDSTEGSLYLGAGVNTVRIGTRIPVLYGTRKIGGHYLSFNVDAKDIALEGDPNEDAEGKKNYFKYDHTTQPTVVRPDGSTVSIVPYRAVYASATPSPTNIPVAA
jgi:predicted phage tail protein